MKKMNSVLFGCLAICVALANVAIGQDLRGAGLSVRPERGQTVRPANVKITPIGQSGEAPLGQALLDSFTHGDTTTFTGSTPRTYMGDCFTNNTLPAGTTAFKVTGLTFYFVVGAAATFTNVRSRIQLWNTCTAANTPVFTNPAGAVIVTDLGPITATGASFFTVNLTLPAPITLTGGSGTNWGFSQNFQGDVGGGPVDNTNLTSLIVASTTGTPYVAGTITTGADPVFGYYRNAGGRTDLNFDSTDARSLAGLDHEGVAIKINGVSNAVTAAGVTVGGRVVSAAGRGVTNARVTITNSLGISRTVATGRSGIFNFNDVEAGRSYVISVASRRFSFAPQAIDVSDNVSGLVFTASDGDGRQR